MSSSSKREKKSSKESSWESLSLEDLQAQHRKALQKLAKKDKAIKELRATCQQLEGQIEELHANLDEAQHKVVASGFSLDEGRQAHSESVFGLKLVLREGWLLKKGRINKDFKRRFFVLKSDFPDSSLLYYKHRRSGVSPSGEIVMGSGVAVATEDAIDNEVDGFPFRIETTKRVYHLMADSEDAREAWLQSLYSLKT